MYSSKDFLLVDHNYFEIILLTNNHIQLKSKNTGHYWDIECQNPFYNVCSLVVHHKHKINQEFHIQKQAHPRTILDAQRLIKEHDMWHLNGRKSQILNSRK